MKLKLDENLGLRGYDILVAAGHDVATVATQSMEGSLDRDLIDRCRSEDRCLVTLDLDFANPLIFLPSHYRGIAVLRVPPRPSAADLARLVGTLADALKTELLDGKLWIVEASRIRVYQEKPTD